MTKTDSEAKGTTPLPDFFIVGAPKCGTTSMYNYLRQHPQIFMPEVKEPHYFAGDLTYIRPERRIADWSKYLSLFENATSDQRVGEASTGYMNSKIAAKQIYEFNPEAQIIIMLRNPIEMMRSLHSHRLYHGIENITDFGKALEAEQYRKRGERMPRIPSLVEGCYYREIADFVPQVNRYLDLFPREQILFIIYENFKENWEEEYRRVLEFLGVDSTFTPLPKVYKPNRFVRVGWLNRIVRHPPIWIRKIARRVLSADSRARIASSLLKKSEVVKPRESLPDDLYAQLAKEFKPKVDELSELIDMDLTFWFSSAA